MARTVRRMKIEQKAAQLGMDFSEETTDAHLLAAIRKTNKDFLIGDEDRTPEEKRRSLVRVSLVCHNPERRARESEQLFLSCDGKIMGQTMFYTAMEDGWHFNEVFLDALLGMMYPDARPMKMRTSVGAVSADTDGRTKIHGMRYDFSARLLPPLTQQQLQKIKQRQLAVEGLGDNVDELMEI